MEQPAPRVLVADEDDIRGLAAGADSSLAQPFSVAGLVDRLRGLTAGARA